MKKSFIVNSRISNTDRSLTSLQNMFIVDEEEGTVVLKTGNNEYSLGGSGGSTGGGNMIFDDESGTLSVISGSEKIDMTNFSLFETNESGVTIIDVGTSGVFLNGAEGTTRVEQTSFSVTNKRDFYATSMSDGKFSILNGSVFFGLANPNDNNSFGVYTYYGNQAYHLYAKVDDVPVYQHNSGKIFGSETLTNSLLNAYMPDRKNGDTVVFSYYEMVATFVGELDRWTLTPYTLAP